MTELGSASALHEVVVEAGDWMTALTRARASIGERGGVPPGGSCAVAPNGDVTVLDGVARRQYHLAPTSDGVTPPLPEPTTAPADAPPAAMSRQTVGFGSGTGGETVVPVGGPSTAAAPAPAQPPSNPSQAAPSAIPDDGAEVLYSRDVEPSAETPLVYRERTLVVREGTEVAAAEAVLRGRFARLRDELEPRPKGKLVNMAVFDHRWEGRPVRPPLVTLQWKDWRGEPEVQRPAASAPVAPEPEAKPAATVDTRPNAPVPSVAPAAVAKPSSPPAAAQTTAAQPAAKPATAAAQPAAKPATAAAQTAAAQTAAAQTAAKPATGKSAPATTSSKAPAARERISTPGPDERLAQAFEGLQDLFFLTTPLEGSDFALDLLKELVPAESTGICLYDINTDEFRFVSRRGAGQDTRKGEAIAHGAGLIGASSSSLRPLMLEQATSDARYDPKVDAPDGVTVRTMALVPISHQGRLQAVLQLVNRTEQAQFSRADANLLSYVADRLGEFLHQARLAPVEKSRPTSRTTRPR